MILKKPYAFFIKYFKLFHLVVSFFIAYLIYSTNNIISFLSEYLSQTYSVVGEDIVNNLFSNYIYLVCAIIMILSLIIFTVMFRKNKSYKPYIINLFIYIAIIVVFVYTRVILNNMETMILNIKIVKLIHDILALSAIFESITFIFFLIRGLGLNIKKFDFSSDIDQFQVDSKDNEEFEINVEVDINDVKKNFKKRFRFFKYRFLESKFKIILSISISIILVICIILYFYLNREKINSEGEYVSVGGLNYIVNSSYILNRDGKSLIVVDLDLSSSYKNKIIYSNDLFISVGNYKIKNTLKYCSSLNEYGTCYNKNLLTPDYASYIFIYEIPEIYLNSNFVLEYIDNSKQKKVKLNPLSELTTKTENNYTLKDTIEFNDRVLMNIDFKINSIDISNSFKINYDYCIDDYCIPSIEYLKPSINSNFDKTILKLNVDYNTKNKKYNSFYNLFYQHGYMVYYIDGVEYTQKSDFEEIKSTKRITNDVYIGVNKRIIEADKIDLIIETKDKKNIYNIKGVN